MDEVVVLQHRALFGHGGIIYPGTPFGTQVSQDERAVGRAVDARVQGADGGVFNQQSDLGRIAADGGMDGDEGESGRFG